MTTDRSSVWPCPTPQKKYRLDDPVLARRVADAMTWLRGDVYAAYRCVCGLHHIKNVSKKRRTERARKLLRDARAVQNWTRQTRTLAAVLTIAEHDEWIW